MYYHYKPLSKPPKNQSRSPTLPPTNKIDGRPQFQQRIRARCHAQHPRDRIKDRGLLQCIVIVRDALDLELTQVHDRVRLGPVHRRVIRDIGIQRHLGEDAEPDGAGVDALLQLRLQVLRVLGGEGVGVEGGDAGGGHDVVADEGLPARGVDESEGRHAPVLLGAVAGGRGLRPLHVCEGLGVGAEEFLDRRGGGPVRGRGADCLEHLEEFRAGARWEGRRGVADDVGVLAASIFRLEVEPDRDSAWVRVGIGIWDVGNPS